MKTNISGDRIDFSFYVVDQLHFTAIANICEIVNVVLKSSSDKWAPTSYKSEIIAQVTSVRPLVKYTLSAIIYSGTDFAKGRVHLSKYLK